MFSWLDRDETGHTTKTQSRAIFWDGHGTRSCTHKSFGVDGFLLFVCTNCVCLFVSLTCMTPIFGVAGGQTRKRQKKDLPEFCVEPLRASVHRCPSPVAMKLFMICFKLWVSISIPLSYILLRKSCSLSFKSWNIKIRSNTASSSNILLTFFLCSW